MEFFTQKKKIRARSSWIHSARTFALTLAFELAPPSAHAQAKPDLRPAPLSDSAIQFAQNSCKVRIGVYNHAPVAAPATQVRLGQQVSADGSVTSVTASVHSIPARKPDGTPGFAYSAWLPTTQFFSNAVNVSFSVQVDAQNAVDEGDGETNNSSTFQRHISTSPFDLWNAIPIGCVARPDLQVTEFQWNPDTCALKLKVQNTGAADSATAQVPQNFLVAIDGIVEESSGNTSWTRNVLRLAKNEVFSTEIQGYRAAPGTLVTRAMADFTSLLSESNEANNRREAIIPEKCYFKPVQKCDFFTTSYFANGSTRYNTIEKLSHTTGSTAFDRTNYWVGATGSVINDIAVVPSLIQGQDEIRATFQNHHEKLRLLAQHTFSLDAQAGGTFLGRDSGHISYFSPASPSGTGSAPVPYLSFSYKRQLKHAPLSDPTAETLLANIGISTLIAPASANLTPALFNSNDSILDTTIIGGEHYVSYFLSNNDQTALIKISKGKPYWIGLSKQGNGNPEKITGLAAIDQDLYGLSEGRSIYKINLQNGSLEFLTQLPNTPQDGSNVQFGKGFGMTVKCAQTTEN